MEANEQKKPYVQTIPLKAQRDALFDACETIQDRQRWFAKVGKKGYMNIIVGCLVGALFMYLAISKGWF